MRALLIGALIAAVVAAPAFAQGDHYVSGYVKRDGTYVAPHYQTNPNSTRNDNYSTRGNVNPYTGQPGTKPRDEDVYGSSSTTQRQGSSTNPYSTFGTTSGSTSNSSPYGSFGSTSGSSSNKRGY